MKYSIYLLIVVFFWGCMIEEGELPDMHPSKTQKSHGLALFFEQKLRNDIQTRSPKMDTVYKHHTLLIENVRLGYSKQYGGYYFIVPLRRVNYTFYQENYRNSNREQHVTHTRPNDGNTQGTVSQLNINNP